MTKSALTFVNGTKLLTFLKYGLLSLKYGFSRRAVIYYREQDILT